MPYQSKKQSLHISSQENLEIEEKNRLALIEAIIELRYNDERRMPPTGIELARIAASWDIHFERAGIPTEELVTLYYDAVANWDGKGIFTPSIMVNFWNKQKSSEYVEYQEFSCQICNGTREVELYDWVTDSTSQVKCGCAI